MKIQEFYDTVDKVVLCPGGLIDLNEIETHAIKPKLYTYMRMSDPKKYVTGIIIPSIKEISDLLQLQKQTINTAKNAFKTSGLYNNMHIKKDPINNDLISEIAGMVEKTAIEMFGDENLQNTDIRMKAAKMGANGLVYFKRFDDKTYMGIPVIGND